MSIALLEFNPEAESLEQESFEASGLATDAEASVLDESQEMEFASGLLEIAHEQGIGRYIDQLITSVAQSCHKPISSLARRELGRLLREPAGRALPALHPQRSLQAGVSSAARVFGLELEGLSNEDRDFETAKGFIRLAESAARRLANEPHGHSPEEAARNALL